MSNTEKDSFESKLARLEKIVATLEQGEVPLEKALTEFQQGIKLSKELRDILSQSEEMLSSMIDKDENQVNEE